MKNYITSNAYSINSVSVRFNACVNVVDTFMPVFKNTQPCLYDKSLI